MAGSGSRVEFSFGMMARRQRQGAQMTPEVLASLAKGSPSDVLLVENGQASTVRRSLLRRLVNALNYRKKRKGRALRLLNLIVPPKRFIPPNRCQSHGRQQGGMRR